MLFSIDSQCLVSGQIEGYRQTFYTDSLEKYFVDIICGNYVTSMETVRKVILFIQIKWQINIGNIW